MSLHIQIQKLADYSVELDKKINVANEFLRFFKDKIEVQFVQLNVTSREISKSYELPKDFNYSEILDLIKKEKLSPFLEALSIEIGFLVSRNSGVIDINNKYASNIFGDVTIEIFSNKLKDKIDLNGFSDLILKKVISSEEIDAFFDEIRDKKLLFQKAFIDLEDSEEDIDPLNQIYIYDLDKASAYRNSLKVIKRLADEDENMEELYYKIRGTDQNVLVNDLTSRSEFGAFAVQRAEKNNLKAAISSFKMAAKNKKDVEKYYRELIQTIFKPMFDPYPPLQKRIDDLAKTIRKDVA